MPKFLVEIGTKTWVTPRRTLSFKEIEATNELTARHKAFDLFEAEIKYAPSIRKLMIENNLTLKDICAGDSVKLT